MVSLWGLVAWEGCVGVLSREAHGSMVTQPQARAVTRLAGGGAPGVGARWYTGLGIERARGVALGPRGSLYVGAGLGLGLGLGRGHRL